MFSKLFEKDLLLYYSARVCGSLRKKSRNWLRNALKKNLCFSCMKTFHFLHPTSGTVERVDLEKGSSPNERKSSVARANQGPGLCPYKKNNA